MTAVEDLHALAAAFGIDTDYWDWRGKHRTVPERTLRAVLAAFEVDTSTPGAVRAALAAKHDGPARTLPHCIVVRSGRSPGVDLTSDEPARIELEDGSTLIIGAADALELPADLPLGYHRLTVTIDGAEHSGHLIVTPDQLPLPEQIAERPAWGIATQLYSVRSRDSWGVGDLTDLRALAGWAAESHGADFVLINPVHAGEVVTPVNPSPYLPTSRRFANPIYLRVEDVPEYAALPAGIRGEVVRLGATVRDEAPDGRIERDPAWVAKLAALQLVLGHGLSDERTADWAAFQARQGVPLERFATWCALCEVHGGDWHTWPDDLQDPTTAAVAAFAGEHAERIRFFAQLQWLLEAQLSDTQDAARAAGMAIGIVHDVAVGVSPSGADAWAWQDAVATSITVGAPPDAYSQMGQDWQQPPWRPDRLAETGYAPFREMFGNVLRYCGGLRVDHIIGLFRLWWIPAGADPLDGTYVRYDNDALIGILALEAQRSGAVIVGEDLGNVEPSAQTYLRERGLLGTSILWFESNSDGGPLAPEHWRQHCLASVTTHDLPPTAGYLAGDHIRLRHELGLSTELLDDELAAGRREQSAWIAELKRVGLLAAGQHDDTEAVVIALHRFLLLTPARLRCVSLTDAVGDRRTQNQPGTTDEYPNWRVPLAGPDGRPMLLDQVFTDPRALRLIRTMSGTD